MRLLPPKITGPVSACSKAIQVEGQLTGAYIKIFADNTVVAEGMANGPRQAFIVNIPLQPNQKIIATQGKDGSVSEPSPRPVSVQNRPAHLGALTYVTPLYECGMSLSLEGAVPGSEVVVKDEDSLLGTSIALGVRTKVDLTHGLVFGSRIKASQTSCEVSGPYTNSPSAAPMPELTAPVISNLIQECQPSFGVSNIVPGARVVFYKNGSKFGAVYFDEPSLWVTVDDTNLLKAGDLITAKQSMCNGKRQSGESNHVYVRPLEKIPKPFLMNSICPRSYVLKATGLIPGSLVTVYNGETEVGTCQTPDSVFEIPVPLLTAGSEISIKQSFCKRDSAHSNSVTVREDGTIERNVLLSPINPCTTRVRLAKLVFGTTLLIMSRRLGPISDYVFVTNTEMDVPISPAMDPGDVIQVKLFVCAGGELLSNEVTVSQPMYRLPNAKVATPLYGGDTYINISRIVIGAFVDIYINNRFYKSIFGNEEMKNVYINPVLRPGDKIKAIQRICNQIADIEEAVTVSWPKPERPSLWSPGPNEAVIFNSVTLSWIDRGRFDQFRKADSFTVLLDVYEGQAPRTRHEIANASYEYIPMNLLADKEYIWQVIAHNRGGDTPSTEYVFRTFRPAPPVTPPTPSVRIKFTDAIMLSDDGVTNTEPEEFHETYAWLRVINLSNTIAENYKVSWKLVDDNNMARIISSEVIDLEDIPTGQIKVSKFLVPPIGVGNYYIEAKLLDMNNIQWGYTYFPFPIW